MSRSRLLGCPCDRRSARASFQLSSSSADVHIVLQRGVAAGANLPSKIAPYLASGRPIVASIDPTTPAARLLEESGAAILVPPESPDALARAMQRLAADRGLRETLGASGRRFAEERLSKNVALTALNSRSSGNQCRMAVWYPFSRTAGPIPIVRCDSSRHRGSKCRSAFASVLRGAAAQQEPSNTWSEAAHARKPARSHPARHERRPRCSSVHYYHGPSPMSRATVSRWDLRSNVGLTMIDRALLFPCAKIVGVVDAHNAALGRRNVAPWSRMVPNSPGFGLADRWQVVRVDPPEVAQLLRFQRPRLPAAAEVERWYSLSRDADWFSNHGPCEQLLADRLAARLRPDATCIPVANATLGLMIALRALMERSGSVRGEVVMPSFTYVATVSAVLWAGYRPIFVDVDRDSWHVTGHALAAAVAERGRRVACLLPCATFGSIPPESLLAEWRSVAAESGLPLLVDNAPGYGSLDTAGQSQSPLGDADVVSFHATKPFAIGEGGAVFTLDEALASRVRELSRFGLDAGRTLTGTPGLNAKMSELHAATGLAMLNSYDNVLSSRRARARRLTEPFLAAGVETQQGAELSTWQFVPLLAPDAHTRDEMLRRAESSGVEVRTYHQPLHSMPSLRDHATVGSLSVSADLGSRIICLPMANDLSEAEIERIQDCCLPALSP